ncbi:hypothetical protein D3C76_1752130 [compost metagenome]
MPDTLDDRLDVFQALPGLRADATTHQLQGLGVQRQLAREMVVMGKRDRLGR